MIEKVSRAICEEARISPEHWRIYQNYARAAVEAMRYRDGADESNAIEVGIKYRSDPVSVIEHYEGMIDAILNEGKPSNKPD